MLNWSRSADLKLLLQLLQYFFLLLSKNICLMKLIYLRMFLQPCLEFHEDVMAKGVAPTLLFTRTALQDCQ